MLGWVKSSVFHRIPFSFSCHQEFLLAANSYLCVSECYSENLVCKPMIARSATMGKPRISNQEPLEPIRKFKTSNNYTDSYLITKIGPESDPNDIRKYEVSNEFCEEPDFRSVTERFLTFLLQKLKLIEN